mmetsp:Transcript_11187/g.10860  ORF Transcript_11187/g.10860 Transcript_11187/m.10860 type:complete len:132 (-) Transcript_11187:478-873(-)
MTLLAPSPMRIPSKRLSMDIFDAAAPSDEENTAPNTMTAAAIAAAANTDAVTAIANALAARFDAIDAQGFPVQRSNTTLRSRKKKITTLSNNKLGKEQEQKRKHEHEHEHAYQQQHQQEQQQQQVDGWPLF